MINITGVEILAIEEVAINFAFNWAAFWIAAGVTFGICLIIGFIVGLTDGWSCFGICVVLGIIFGGILGAIAGAGEQKPTEYEAHYKVTISDEVSMNEFTEKYEIIDQDGKIYTIRERE